MTVTQFIDSTVELTVRPVGRLLVRRRRRIGDTRDQKGVESCEKMTCHGPKFYTPSGSGKALYAVRLFVTES